MVRILFAEDEEILGSLVKDALEHEHNFHVDWYMNGSDALKAFKEQKPDICILDVMMPVMDGFTLAKNIRKTDTDIPILFLTARSQNDDVVMGFESGADDYLKKPFHTKELILRVKAIIKRTIGNAGISKENTDTFVLGKYTFQPNAQILYCDEARYDLTAREADLLRILVQHKNEMVNRAIILKQLWGDDSFFNARSMDVFIAKLRKYLAHDNKLSIINVRGFGYKLVEQHA